MKKVLVLGGGGFIGSYTVKEFVKKKYSVTVLDIKAPIEGFFPKQVNVVVTDISTLDESKALELLKGFDAVVFAGGADDRVLPKKPAIDFFRKANVDTASKFFSLSKKAKIKKWVLLSSYFAYFARAWPEMKLAEKHAYIKSRIEQEEACKKLATSGYSLTILELPYIFGVAKGKTPLWKPLINYFKNSPVIFYPGGGTTFVSVESVAEAIVNSVEQEENNTFVVSDENMSWVEFIKRILKIMNQDKIIVTLPKFLTKIAAFFLKIVHSVKGLESGLEPVSFIDLEYKNTFFDSGKVSKLLKYSRSGLDKSFREVVEASIGEKL